MSLEPKSVSSRNSEYVSTPSSLLGLMFNFVYRAIIGARSTVISKANNDNESEKLKVSNTRRGKHYGIIAKSFYGIPQI